ncbi:MAG TPA: hypothetical protein DCL61_14590 [Cyanobacteria bacterium UBA12227]|nr:hypothetical protein [Cyanobacteria bacterium UBA12227]
MYEIEYKPQAIEDLKYFKKHEQQKILDEIPVQLRYEPTEVFYAEDGSLLGCTEKAVEPWGQSLEELAKNIEWFKEALALPILTLADIPAQQMKSEQKQERVGNISHEQLMVELGLAKPFPTN